MGHSSKLDRKLMLTNDLSLRESANSNEGITVLNADQIAEQILQQHRQQIQQHHQQQQQQEQHQHQQLLQLSHPPHAVPLSADHIHQQLPQQQQGNNMLIPQEKFSVSSDFQAHSNVLTSPLSGQEVNENGVGRQRESYTARDKIAMVKKFKNISPPLSIRRFAMQFGIPANTFKHWIVAYGNGVPEELGSLESQSRRRIRPGKFPLMEQKVVDFLKNRDAEGTKVDSQVLRDLVEQWAKELLTEKEMEEFKITPSWIQRVLRRHALNNVDGVEVMFAAGAELDSAMLAPSSTIPDESDIQQISEKFLSKKRLRDPDDDASGNANEHVLPRPIRARPPTTTSNKPSRRSSSLGTANSLQDSNAEMEQASRSLDYDSSSPVMQLSSSADQYTQLEADNLSSLHRIIVEESSAPIHVNQALHAVDIISRFVDEQGMPPQCKDLLGQLSAFLHSNFQHQLSHVVAQQQVEQQQQQHTTNASSAHMPIEQEILNVQQSLVSVQQGNVVVEAEPSLVDHNQVYVQHHLQQLTSSQEMPQQLSSETFATINHHLQLSSVEGLINSDRLL